MKITRKHFFVLALVNEEGSLSLLGLDRRRILHKNEAFFNRHTVGTESVRTPVRTLWGTAVFARQKSGQIFIRFE